MLTVKTHVEIAHSPTLIYNFKMKKKSVASNVIIGLILNNRLFNVFVSAFKLKTVTHIKCTLSV